MELKWIEDFLALERTHNFTLAAAERNSTQSAYSRRIKQLEYWLGVSLIERAARPVTLTKAGDDFLARARQMRDDILDARRSAMAMGSHYENGARVYITHSLAAGFLAQILVSLNLENCSVVVASYLGCLEALRNGRANHAFVPNLSKNDPALRGFHQSVFGHDQLIFIGPTKKIRLEKNNLSGPVFLYSPGSLYESYVSSFLQKAKIKIGSSPLVESPSPEALLALVKAGIGGGWIPASMAKEERSFSAKLTIPYRILQLSISGSTI